MILSKIQRITLALSRERIAMNKATEAKMNELKAAIERDIRILQADKDDLKIQVARLKAENEKLKLES